MRTKVTIFLLLALLLLVAMAAGCSPKRDMEIGYCDRDTCDIYNKIDETGRRVVATVARGDQLDIVSQFGSWFEAKAGNQTGWIKKRYVSPTKPE